MGFMVKNGNGGVFRLVAIWEGRFAPDRSCAQVSLGLPKGPTLLQSVLEVDVAAYA